MLFLLAISLSLLFLLALNKSIRKHPVPFYIATVVIIVYLFGAYLTGNYGWWPDWFMNYFVMLFARGALSTAMFAIVMYVAVLPEQWSVTKKLRGVRAEASIIASILALGHNIYYGIYYFPHFFTEIHELEWPYAVATGISIVLILIMLPLLITSFRCVRKRMQAAKWKRLQQWAYLFYALLYGHIALVMGAAIAYHIRNGLPLFEDIFTLAAYTAVFVPYFVLRLRKARLSKANRN